MRLIDADALKTRKSINNANYNSIETIQEWIDNAPTIDAVPVVRCGECKWGEELAPELIYCDDTIGGVVKRTDFCSYGERRE